MGILDSFGGFIGGLFEPPRVDQRRITPAGAKIQVLDAIHPRKLCLGYRGWPSSIMWHNSHAWDGSEAPKAAYTMVLGIADQLSGAMKAIWLDDERFTVGTNAASNGDHFVPASNFSGQFDELSPHGWYVPNINRFSNDDRLNHWARRENNGDWKPAVSFKYYDGSQTVPDGRLETLFGFANDSGTRVRSFRRITYLAITFRAGLTTRGGDGGDYGGSDVGPRVPAVLVESEGNREVYDWRTSTSGYTRNGVLCMAKWMMWEYGVLSRVDDAFNVLYPLPDDFSSSHMISEANLCAEAVTINASAGTQPRYTVDAEIEADASTEHVFDQFSFALGGVKVFRRPSTKLWRIRCGRYNAPSMTIAETDYKPRQVRTRFRTPLQDRRNSVLVKYPDPKSSWEMVDARIVTDPIYLAADNGAQRLRAVTADFVGGSGVDMAGARARRLALIWLDQHRLEKVQQAAFPIDAGRDGSNKAGVIRLEIGDTVAVNNERYGFAGQEFTVESIGYEPASLELGLQLRETGSGLVRYDGQNSEDEEGPAGQAKWWSKNELAPVTGLTAAVVPGSGHVQADGRIWVSVLVDWDTHPDVRVDDRGQYRLEYKLQSHVKWAAETSTASRNQILVKARADYDIRVRAETLEGRSEWNTGLLFADTTFADLPGPPGTLSYGDNLVDDPNFEQGGDNWEFTFAGGGGWAGTIEPTGGRAGPHVALLRMLAGSTTTDVRLQPKTLIPVEAGQRFLIRAWRQPQFTSDTTRTNLNMQFYGIDGLTDFISTTTVNQLNTTGEITWRRQKGIGTVPNDDNIRFMRPQMGLQQVDGYPVGVYVDGFRVWKVLGGESTVASGAAGTDGQTWQTCRSINAATPGDSVYIKCEFGARWGDPDTGATQPIQFRYRVIRFDEDGTSNETTIVDATALGDTVPLGTTYGPWEHFAVDALDETGDRGTFIYRVQFSTENPAGHSQVRNRLILWALAQDTQPAT